LVSSSEGLLKPWLWVLQISRRCSMISRILSPMERAALMPEAAALAYSMIYHGFPPEDLERALLDAVLLHRLTGVPLDQETLREAMARWTDGPKRREDQPHELPTLSGGWGLC